MNAILYVNILVGWVGFDRLIAGSVYSGILKLFAFLVFLPLGVLWNIMDYLSLLLFNHFAGGDTVYVLSDKHKIITTVLYVLLILILLILQRRIIRYCWTPQRRRRLREKYREKKRMKYTTCSTNPQSLTFNFQDKIESVESK